MQTSHKNSIFWFLLLFSMILSGCAGSLNPNQNSAINSNTSANKNPNAEIVPQEEVEELGRIIKLSILPEEAIYLENASGTEKNSANEISSAQKKLLAVLKYNGENASQVAAQAASHKPAAPADIDAETWFPPELIAKSQETGDEFLKGTAFAANDFLQSPYLNGRLTRVNDTNYFVLELTTY